MAAFIIIAVLAAFGMLCALWVIFGFLLPGQRGGAAVLLCRGDPGEEAVIRRYLWLYNTGLIRCPLLLVDHGLTEQDRDRYLQYRPGIALCTPEALSGKLEQEREYLGGTGT